MIFVPTKNDREFARAIKIFFSRGISHCGKWEKESLMSSWKVHGNGIVFPYHCQFGACFIIATKDWTGSPQPISLSELDTYLKLFST